MSTTTLPQLESLRKQSQSEGGGVPRWLSDQGIGAGEWQSESKPRLRRVATDETWTDKARVWASLSLHSFGFSSPVAIRLDKGKPVLLTRGDIAKETGLPGPRVRRALAVLESDGWIERASVSGKADLERGDIEIRVFAIPRAAVAGPESPAEPEAASYASDGLPDELLRYLKRYKVRELPDSAGLERAKDLCHRLSELEGELRRVLKPELEGDSAQPPTGTRADPVEKPATGAARSRSGVRAPVKSGAHKSVGVKDSERKLASVPVPSVLPLPNTDSLEIVAAELERIATARLPRMTERRPNPQTCRNFLRVLRTVKPDAVADEVPGIVFAFVRREDQNGSGVGFETWGGVFKVFREFYEVQKT